ncbi:MAG TPA: hypothetical protein VMF29_08750 [Candidatus Edwardsbacteria bacterium]|nr:hypothetical protein [Candidatus Edwardsbacteria bacterium]
MRPSGAGWALVCAALVTLSCGGGLERGRLLLRAGDYRRAAAVLDAAVARRPADPAPRRLLLEALCGCDSGAAALAEFGVLARLSPQDCADPWLRAKVAGYAGLEPYRVVRLTPGGGKDALPCFSRDGSRIAFSSKRDGNPELYVMAADGSGQRRVTHDPAVDYNPAFSPDGRTLAYVSDRVGRNQIYLCDLESGRERRLTYSAADDQQPKFSPDGQELYFLSDRSGRYTIWRMGIAAAGSGREGPAAPAFPDSTAKLYFDTQGGRVLLQEQTADEVRLLLGSLETLETRPIAFPAFRAALPTILSPDGRRILFVSDRDGNDEIYLYEIDSGRTTRLTVNPGQDFCCGFSPDGRRVLFDSVRDGARDVYLMDLDQPLPLDRLARAVRRTQS